MPRVTVRFQQAESIVEKFSISISDEVFTKVEKGLSKDVFKESGDDWVVTFDLSKPVPDVIRYWMSEEKWEHETDKSWMTPPPKATKGFPWGRPPRSGETNGVLFLLESPHRDEISDALKPFVPAAGTAWGDTGRLLHVHREALIYILTHKIGIAFGGERKPVIIGNPFQYPASLRTKDLVTSLRDEIWIRAMLRNRFHDDLLTRLGQYAPRVIINACTGEQGVIGSPKALTRYFIDEYLERNTITRVARTTYRRSPEKDSITKEITHRAHVEQHGDLENAECHVIELPHPASWRYNLEDWFPADTDYARWVESRRSLSGSGAEAARGEPSA